MLNKESLSNITFVYTPSDFTWTMTFSSWATTKDTTTTLNLTSTHYPVDYSLTWSLDQTYTWTISSATDVIVVLSSWDWVKSLSWTLTNQANETSDTFTWSITLDQTAPTATLTADKDSGTPVQDVTFTVSSSDSDFDTTSISWSNNKNATTWTWLTYTLSWLDFSWVNVSVNYTDTLWNAWTETLEWYTLDNTAPNPPTNMVINNWSAINVSNVSDISLSWSWELSESWAIVNYSFTDTWTWEVSWTGVLSWTDIDITGLDLSNLTDWTISYSITLEDEAWNTSTSVDWNVNKETISPTGSISLTSIVNSTWTTVTLTSSEYPVDYTITWDIVWTNTWVLSESWDVNIELSNWDWAKNISVIFTDSWDNTSPSYDWSTTLDQTAPVINILSHSNNQQLEWANITLTWTVSDTNWISSLTINSTDISLSQDAFSSDISLVWGANTISYSLQDTAWNTTSSSIDIVRLSQTSNIYSYVTWT